MLLLVAVCRILFFVASCGCRNAVGFNHRRRVHMAFPRVTWMTSPLISFTFSVFFNENTNIPEGIKRFFFRSLRKFEWLGFSAVERYNIVYLYSRMCVRKIHEILDAGDRGRVAERGREGESVTENSVNRAKKFSKQSLVFCVCVCVCVFGAFCAFLCMYSCIVRLSIERNKNLLCRASYTWLQCMDINRYIIYFAFYSNTGVFSLCFSVFFISPILLLRLFELLARFHWLYLMCLY